ncbi:TraB/GumN family protein [Ferruginibacter paludis]|uniref:TraB/GumN family protein n=1 Tax=Ferruginibacter paludis TaxID=1310417 RepID=UPI0025B4BE82|nr:TraB/GumN family protein [Ferruginibacter paludis]MDN3656456.1 TraB/GumN family protein [Ferruginibacter paludis]
MKYIQTLLLISVFYSCNAQPALPKLLINKDDNSLLWQVSGNGLQQPSYIFGTFHLMCKNDIHFSNQLATAVKRADKVYMEMDMDDPATILGGFTLMTMKDGKTLEQLYSDAEYKRVRQFFLDSLKTSLSFVARMKPFFLEALLYPKMMPCKTISGVEEELVRLAKTNKKEIRGLETMEFQAAVFDSIPYEEQAKELLKSIDSMESNKKSFDTMMQVYKNQQLNEMENLFSKSESGMENHQDLLLNNRNKNWVAQLKNIMKKNPVFVAVGAGHLVGEKGLIALLRKKGYTVQPLQNR